jgi:hypothetical protein
METLQRIKTVSISLLEETLDCSEVRDDRSGGSGAVTEPL